MASAATDKTVCAICCKFVLDRGVECDSNCKRWFHPECVKLTTAEYKKIADGMVKIWNCDRADCNIDQSTNPLNDLNKKVTAILNQFSQLATKSEINDGISSLKSDIQTLSAKLDAMEPRLLKVEAKTHELEQKINKFNSGISNENDLIAEVNDRCNRARNVILHKIPECPSSSTDLKKKHDVDKLAKLFNAMGLDLSYVSFYRIGKPSGPNPRPIKLILSSKEEAVTFFKKFSQDNIVKADSSMADVSASRDRTPKERQLLQTLNDELKDRSSAGETNLTIKFVNGVPRIVEKSKN